MNTETQNPKIIKEIDDPLNPSTPKKLKKTHSYISTSKKENLKNHNKKPSKSPKTSKNFKIDLKKLKMGSKFHLISKKVRESMFEDILEYDRCYYINKYNIELYPQKKKNLSYISTITNTIKNKWNDIQLNIWKSDIIQSIKNNEKRDKIRQRIFMLMNQKGFPDNQRKIIWKYFIGNKLKISKKLFNIYITKIDLTKNLLIEKDLKRSFFYLTKDENFKKVLIEAKILLYVFVEYRPDIKYVQGMSYLIIMLLINFSPYKSFKLFCNLILTKGILYKTFYFNEEYIKKIHFVIEDIISFYFEDLYILLKNEKIFIWNIFWIEWIYALFLKSFDIRTCLILWDFLIIEGDEFFFKFIYSVFFVVNENIGKLGFGNFYEDFKVFIFGSYGKILDQIVEIDFCLSDDIGSVREILSLRKNFD